MLNNEIYWTEEYILYAEMVEKKQKQLEEENAKINVEQDLQAPQEEEKEINEC